MIEELKSKIKQEINHEERLRLIEEACGIDKGTSKFERERDRDHF